MKVGANKDYRKKMKTRKDTSRDKKNIVRRLDLDRDIYLNGRCIAVILCHSYVLELKIHGSHDCVIISVAML